MSIVREVKNGYVVKKRMGGVTVLKTVRSDHITETDTIIENYGAMFRRCISQAVSEARRPRPPKSSVDWLDDIFPDWRENYQVTRQK